MGTSGRGTDSNGGGNEGEIDAATRDLLTVGQAASYLQLSPSSIRSYIRQAALKAISRRLGEVEPPPGQRNLLDASDGVRLTGVIVGDLVAHIV